MAVPANDHAPGLKRFEWHREPGEAEDVWRHLARPGQHFCRQGPRWHASAGGRLR